MQICTEPSPHRRRTLPTALYARGVSHKPRVLVVEDERTIAQAIAARLEADGFAVERARSAATPAPDVNVTVKGLRIEGASRRVWSDTDEVHLTATRCRPPQTETNERAGSGRSLGEALVGQTEGLLDQVRDG